MSLVAAIQMCSSDNVADNLKQAQVLIKQAVQMDARLIVLPEMFAIFGKNDQDKLRVKESYGHGPIQSFLSEQASIHQAWILGGTIPITCAASGKVRAASILYNHYGDAVARYDKSHLFDVTLSEEEQYLESNTTEAGSELIVIDTPVGKLGLGVCFDVRFPEMFLELAKLGAEIIALPSAFTMKTGEAHWELLTRSRAVDSFCYLIGAAQGGLHAGGRKTYGHSLIVDPWGEMIASLNNDAPGVIVANVDLESLHHIRRAIPTFKKY